MQNTVAEFVFNGYICFQPPPGTVSKLKSAMSGTLTTRQDGGDGRAQAQNDGAGRAQAQNGGAGRAQSQDVGDERAKNEDYSVVRMQSQDVSDGRAQKQDGGDRLQYQDGVRAGSNGGVTGRSLSSGRLAKRTATRPLPGSVKQLIARFDQIIE